MGKKNTGALTDSLKVLERTKNYNRWIYDNIKDYAGNNILEIGCGTGNNTDMLLKSGAKITGIEIDRKYYDCAAAKYKKNKNVKIIHADFLKTNKLKKNFFDTVIMLNVLEHIKNDSAAVKKIHSLLKKGGRFINLAPAMRFACGRLDKELGHYRRYEKKDIRRLLKKNGFSAEKIFYMNIIGAAAWWANKNRRGFPSSSPVIFDKFFVPVLKPAEKILRPLVFMGQSIISVAKK